MDKKEKKLLRDFGFPSFYLRDELPSWLFVSSQVPQFSGPKSWSPQVQGEVFSKWLSHPEAPLHGWITELQPGAGLSFSLSIWRKLYPDWRIRWVDAMNLEEGKGRKDFEEDILFVYNIYPNTIKTTWANLRKFLLERSRSTFLIATMGSMDIYQSLLLYPNVVWGVMYANKKV